MDIRQATNIARAMVMHYGMSDKLGFQLLGVDESKNPWEQPDKLFSEETAKLIDQEVKAFIDLTYQQTKDLLESKRQELEYLAQALLRYETLNRDEVERAIKGQGLGKPTVGDLLKAEHNKSKEGKTIRPDNPSLDNDAPGTALPSPA